MSAAASGYCPQCRSGWIRPRIKMPWECRSCGHKFDEPLPIIGVARAQRALDAHPAEDAFWGTQDGQQVLEFAALMSMRPKDAGAGWSIRFAIRTHAPAVEVVPIVGQPVAAGTAWAHHQQLFGDSRTIPKGARENGGLNYSKGR